MTSNLGLMGEALTVNTAFDEIPVIDLADATSDDPAARQLLANQIRDACVRVGFFYVKNHLIPPSLPQRAVESSLPFFELPMEQKMKYDIHASSNFKGYNAFLSENTDPEGRGDLNEGFNFGWEALEGDESEASAWAYTAGPMGGANVWPQGEDMQEFRRAMLAYYHAAVRLGLQLFPLLALALGLPEDFFADKTTKPAAIMRILHYPPQFGPVDDRVIGIGAHTDYEVFTILYQQDDIQALQVLNSAGKWVNAVPIPGTLVVNLGDQLARWTSQYSIPSPIGQAYEQARLNLLDDLFKSTVHRAINRSGVRRYSIPLFFGTDYDVTVEALPSCVFPEHPAKYAPIKAGDYVKSRLEATYSASKVA